MAKLSIMLYTAFVWWCYFTNTPATCSVNNTDRLALMAFKAAIHENPFGALTSWNDTLHFCDWKGVLCSRRHRHRVIALNLMSQGLVGLLSPHIGNLSFLRSIILQNNSFHGPIPQEMGNLFRLQYIKLSNNSFSGEIPKNLSHCSNLNYLNLIDNILTGNIPSELGSLSKLQLLGLSLNKLSGPIPPSLGNLSSLSHFSLGECGLQGEIPEEISQLEGLSFIQLSGNNLTGMVPSGLFNISTINYFALGNNQLQGSIPPLALPNLEYLDFNSNQFTGMIPISLSNATGLKYIDFFSNDFMGPMPKDLGRLTGLQLMFFSHNRLQDDFSFISSLKNCSSLQGFDVERNLLKGSLPSSIANLSIHVSFISAGFNQLQGAIPSGIENLLNLNVISASMNYLDVIPTTIGKLQKLQELYLHMNKFTELPSSLGNLTLLNRLYLGSNNIYGSIPLSLSNCHNLLDFDLSYNNLNGPIPGEIMSLTSISISFSLAHNSLTGFLPSEVGSLRNLVELDVSNNNLSGSIPNSLSDCLSLQRLHLEGNSFDGEIPQGLHALRGLQLLDLSRNNLSGEIPTYLADLGLDKLNLSFNRLHGKVPIKGVFKNASAVSLVGNNELCGGIADLKLPTCPPLNSKKNRLSHAVKVIISVVVMVVAFCIILLLLFIFLYQQRVTRNKGSSEASFKHQLIRTSYGELLKATDGFSDANLIGGGSYGSVYKGILDQIQTIVAVKVFNLLRGGASKSFMSECKALRAIRHRNLLKILSACSSVDFQGNEFKALIYEYMANGSLEKWLHPDGVRSEETKYLKLMERLNISIDIASALEYLHYHCESTIVHGDLKPSNVLLDDDMIAHVGDFGLARVISTISGGFPKHHSDSVAVKGTIGYVAPEYGMGDMVSTQGDVYSFGILLLEMFTSKMPTDDAFKDDLSLHNYVKSCMADNVMEIVDPYILLKHGTTSEIKDCMISILRIGVACSVELPRDRMEMREVISELCKIKEVYTNKDLDLD